MKQVYVTLLSSKDYLSAVIILNRNLKELKCKYSLLVLVTNDIFNDVQFYLEQECIEYRNVPVVNYPDKVKNYYPTIPSLMNTASKINIFTLKDFDKVVYVDADSFFFTPIDELFNYPDGAMYEGFGVDAQMGFSGLFVCCPKCHTFEFYETLLTEYSLLDGSLLAMLWFPYFTNQAYHIPPKYFVPMRYDDFDSLIPMNENIYGVHFCSVPKPWNFRNAEEYITKLDLIIDNLGKIRRKLVKIYFDKYIIPLRNDYPELFK